MATGLLVVLVGPFTRLEPYLSAAEKSYLARMSFGVETDTDDAEGTAVRSEVVPPECADPAHAREILSAFVGPSLQRPPAFSAIKVGGKVAHRAARAGDALELAPRPIEVIEASLESVDPVAHTWDVAFRVSKGTYVRALARDIGIACGTAAHLSGLRRTASGNLSVDAAHSIADVESAAAEGHVAALFTDPVSATGLPAVSADGATRDGRRVARPLDSTLQEGERVAVTDGERLAGIYVVRAAHLVPEAIMPTEDVP
jgi:tRNA pseudouridine55 synthase